MSELLKPNSLANIDLKSFLNFANILSQDINILYLELDFHTVDRGWIHEPILSTLMPDFHKSCQY